VRVSPKTRNNYLNALTELFNFSKSRGYLPKLLPTAVEKVKRLKGPKLRNNILVYGDMTRLLESATGDLLPPLAIKAFSGVRTEEMSKLSWDAVKFNQRSIIIEASISKLGQRRVVPLVNNLALWLEPFKNQTGIICKKWSNPHQLSKAWKKFGAKIGVNITKNSFRNSYISYRLALPTPSAIVAQECGNSPRIIESEYKELATNDEGVAWFDIRPPANYLAKMKEELAKGENTDITPV
jgi:integrase